MVPRENESSLVIFENGNSASLPYALENRKTYESKSSVKENDSIIDIATYVLNNTGHICYIVKDAKNRYEIINSPLRHELGDLEKFKVSKVKVSRSEDVYVVGELICTSEKPTVYILCKLYCF